MSEYSSYFIILKKSHIDSERKSKLFILAKFCLVRLIGLKLLRVPAITGQAPFSCFYLQSLVWSSTQAIRCFFIPP